jgi:glycerol-3-phosphate acyltransferase PlsX
LNGFLAGSEHPNTWWLLNGKDRPVIAVDAMGGDNAPREIVAGAIAAYRDGFARVVLVGDKDLIQPFYTGVGKDEIPIVHAPEVIPMDVAPSAAIRGAERSSLGAAIELVRENKADAIVSAGSSGAFLAIALIRLRTIAGIARPAIGTILPTPLQPVVLIDAGANVDCKPEWLMQFGIMGSAYAQAVLGMKSPRVAIVSIGEERGKGNAQVLEAAELLESAPINFIGNAEGRDVFSGRADVLVTDGFVGNVMLKLAEAESIALQAAIRDALLTSGPDVQLGALLTRRAFSRLKRTLHYETYGGAPLLGLRGNCIVAHGRSSRVAIRNAIRVAATEVREDVIGKIAGLVAPLVQAARA